LPPFPAGTGDQPAPPQAACWSFAGDYIHTLPANIPTKPDRRWSRGNFSGVSVPGWSGGHEANDRSTFMSWELPTFSVADQNTILAHYAGVCGYTHIVLSRPQAINWGVSLDGLIDCAKRCKAAGLFVEMVAVSDGVPFSDAIPWLQALLNAGGLVADQDLVCACWQVDKWYAPAPTVQLILDNGAWSHRHGLLTTVHWGGGYPGWAESCACWDETTDATWGIHDRWSFQRVLAPWLDGHDGQCDVDAPIDEKQSWLIKALVAMPAPMFLVAMEITAQGRFDNPAGWTERFCDLAGLLCVYADPSGRVAYGNGARRPDGTVL